MRDGDALFSGGLTNVCALAYLKMNRLLEQIDERASSRGLDSELPPPERFAPTRACPPLLNVDLADQNVRTVIWATGFKPDYSWLHVPVFDRKGNIVHDEGVIPCAPGLYVMGLPFSESPEINSH